MFRKKVVDDVQAASNGPTQNARIKISPISKVDPLHWSSTSIHHFSLPISKAELWIPTFTHLKHIDEEL